MLPVEALGCDVAESSALTVCTENRAKAHSATTGAKILSNRIIGNLRLDARIVSNFRELSTQKKAPDMHPGLRKIHKLSGFDQNCMIASTAKVSWV